MVLFGDSVIVIVTRNPTVVDGIINFLIFSIILLVFQHFFNKFLDQLTNHKKIIYYNLLISVFTFILSLFFLNKETVFLISFLTAFWVLKTNLVKFLDNPKDENAWKYFVIIAYSFVFLYLSLLTAIHYKPINLIKPIADEFHIAYG